MSFVSEHLDDLGGEIPVEISLDEMGFLGRECPEEECLGHFKVKPGTGCAGYPSGAVGVLPRDHHRSGRKPVRFRVAHNPL